ncbi:hypothetical protein DRJ22_01380 [Candidatus Woesearchaeota archaeon]|nr:MAG: hypothetical protein B6U93_00730 [Candidatus Woesearchaeota archaeon ex4484_78]RLE46653.1 MAG: hypothetical protein DRJ22_01380 [Candidatus Woesearchaeota archaeon]
MAKHFPIRHRYTDIGKDRITVANWYVKYKEVFDLKQLYTLVHEWLFEEGWCTRNDQDFPEIFYSQREAAFGKDHWIRWRLTKKPEEGAIFFNYEFDIEFHTVGIKDTEIIIKGQKYKMNKGEAEVRVNTGLIVDYSGYFKTHPLLKPFKKIWINRLLKKKIEYHKRILSNDSYRLREAINTYLRLEKILPEKEFQEFWPTKSLD